MVYKLQDELNGIQRVWCAPGFLRGVVRVDFLVGWLPGLEAKERKKQICVRWYYL